MTLQDRIITLSEYSLSFETYEGNFVVAIAYKPNWKVKEPENEKIKFYADKENKGVCYYEMPIGGDIEEVFKCIDEVIEHNKEIEKKIELYKEYVEKLKNLFKTEKLSVLKTLKFDVKRLKEKKRIKDIKQTTKEAEIKEKAPSDANIENISNDIVEVPEKTNVETSIDVNIENKIANAIKKKEGKK